MVMVFLGQFACRATAASNLYPLLSAKFGWDNKAEAQHIAMLTVTGILSEIVGSFFGGILLKYGRRRTLMIGVCIMMTSGLFF